jgi:bifunctional non-homologous end joining protein LigD
MGRATETDTPTRRGKDGSGNQTRARLSRALRTALGRPAKREVFLYAFDLLELDGHDLRREAWSDRRWKLARLLRGAGHGVQLSDHMEGNDGHAAFRHACAMGLEGIVAKRRDKPYQSTLSKPHR